MTVWLFILLILAELWPVTVYCIITGSTIIKSVLEANNLFKTAPFL